MSHITSSFETVKMWKLFSTCILRKEPFVILTFDGNVFFFQAIKYNFNEKYKVFSSQASVYYNMVGTTN